jgi:hypothetical protein
MVIIPTGTGGDNRVNSAVIASAHTNKRIFSSFMFLGFMLVVVEIRFSAPRMEDTQRDTA